ncbi:MAG: FISUMP domain-containing protein [Candidatus Cryptobacteroides sp.]
MNVNKNKMALLCLLVIAVTAAFSCKKEETTETAPSLDGILKFTVPEFVEAGSTHTITPRGVSHPEGKGIGYYWKVTPGAETADTVKTEDGPGDGSLTYTFDDEIGDYTVACTAFASGYYSKTASFTVTLVKGGAVGGSITENGIGALDQKITDERDSKAYYTIKHGNLLWFRNNLAYEDAGVPYANCESMNDVLGRYYTWEEAVTACPEGWRLPTDREWCDLAEELTGLEFNTLEPLSEASGALMVNAKFNSELMWEFWPQVKITNASGLSVLPSGYATISDNFASFSGAGDFAVFWTADQADGEKAIYRYIHEESPDFMSGISDKESFAASVRCVKEAE